MSPRPDNRDERLNAFLMGDLQDAEKALQMVADSDMLLDPVRSCIEEALECVRNALKLQAEVEPKVGESPTHKVEEE